MNALHSSLFLPWLLSYLFNALWQIPLVFAAAWIAARMLRRASPQAEHRVWVAALLLEIALPACSFQIAHLWKALLSLLPTTSAVGSGAIRVVYGSATAVGGTLRLPIALEVALVLTWICCMLYFASRLAWGLHQTRTLACAATRITLDGETALRFSQHCERLDITTPPPAIAISPHAIGPVTVGLRRGLLLLPSGFLENIPASDLDAVLAHELVHIARRDFAKNLLYGFASLPMSWHPLMWRTRARVAESRELVCDAIAAETISGRKQYAQSLLHIASMLAGRPPVAALHALGILGLNPHGGTFERRIMVLNRKPASIGILRRVLIAAALSAIGFATCASALALHTDVAAPSSDASQNAAPSKIHVKSGIMAGQKISGDSPKYPEDARAKKVQGTVVLDVTIGKDGVVENILVQKTPADSLAGSAMDAVRTWRYRPYLLNGDPVPVETTVNVTFTLGG